MSIQDQLGITQAHIGDDEKMWGALSQLIPIIGLAVVFVLDEQKNKPYVRYHAVTSVMVTILGTIITVVSCGLGGTLWALGTLFLAWKAYEGEVIEVPWVSQFLLDKGYLDGVKQLTSGQG
jgi:uncharacterized membrane protein